MLCLYKVAVQTLYIYQISLHSAMMATITHFVADIPLAISPEALVKFNRWRAASLSRSAIHYGRLFGELKHPVTLNHVQALLTKAFKRWNVPHIAHTRGWMQMLHAQEFDAEYDKLMRDLDHHQTSSVGFSGRPDGGSGYCGRRGTTSTMSDPVVHKLVKPPRFRALVRDLLTTHRRLFKDSIALRNRLLMQLEGVEAPRATKDKVMRAVPVFPRAGLTLMDLSRNPEAFMMHRDSKIYQLISADDDNEIFKQMSDIIIPEVPVESSVQNDMLLLQAAVARTSRDLSS